MSKIQGIGGIFIKARNATRMKAWYDTYLGTQISEKGYQSFHWNNPQDGKPGRTEFSIFDEKTDYLAPSASRYMINFRVENLPDFVDRLRKEGIELVGGIEEFPYGRFAWILDPEGNKIELWEPKEEGFDLT